MSNNPTRFWNSIKKVTPFARMKLEDAQDPRSFIGRSVLARKTLSDPDEEVIIADIKGCIAADLIKHFQINETHICSMFSFYTQMLENRTPTDEEMNEFDLASDVKDIREQK